MEREFTMLPGEYWWGGAVNSGHLMPLDASAQITLDPDKGRENDQFAPLFVSSKGRYIWSERPFVLTAGQGKISCRGAGEILLNSIDRDGTMHAPSIRLAM